MSRKSGHRFSEKDMPKAKSMSAEQVDQPGIQATAFRRARGLGARIKPGRRPRRSTGCRANAFAVEISAAQQVAEETG
jgi:hypothetical protein